MSFQCMSACPVARHPLLLVDVPTCLILDRVVSAVLQKKTEVIQVTTHILQSYFNGHVSLVSDGQSASSDVGVVDYFCWSFPTTCILGGRCSMEIDDITYFVLEALTCRSCLRGEGSLDTCLCSALDHCLYTNLPHALDVTHGAWCCIV